MLKMIQQVEWQAERVEQIQEFFLQQAKEKTIAHYFEKLAGALPKDLGEATLEARSYF